MTPPPDASTTKPAVPYRSPLSISICVVATLVCLALDLGTKEWALESLSAPYPGGAPPLCVPSSDGFIRMQRIRTEPVVLIENYLEFRYAENCGAAFSMGFDGPAVLRKVFFPVAAVVASIALLTLYVRGFGRALFAWSVPLVVSGAIGNLVDRLRHGFVVDFIRFHLQNGWEWPTFNVADITIVVGVALLMLDGWTEPRPESEGKGTTPSPPDGSASKS